MPRAISSPRVNINIWYHSDPHDQWKRVAWPFLFVTASGCLLGRNSYWPMTDLQFFPITFRLFSQRGRRKKNAAFCTIRLDVLQGMSVEIFARKSKIWPVCGSTLNISAKKTGSYTKTKSFEGNNVLTHFHAQNSSNVHAVFER